MGDMTYFKRVFAGLVVFLSIQIGFPLEASEIVFESPELTGTLGEQRTLIILVNFQDDASEPWTVNDVTDVMDGNVNAFIEENSYGQTWLNTDVVGWYTLALDGAECDSWAIQSAADDAAWAAGIDVLDYDRLLYAFPHSSSCGWAGLSTVGGEPSQVWLNGTIWWNTITHELGHSLGLWHSHGLDCGDTTIGENCTSHIHGDKADIMGSASPGHFNAFQKERLGWLGFGNSPPILTVEVGGLYYISSYEIIDLGEPLALKILKSIDPVSGVRTWYYLEYRQLIGFDSGLANLSPSNLTKGLLLHRGSEGNGNSGYLLNTNPETNSFLQSALEPGESFTDPEIELTITTEWTDAFGATVSISFGPIIDPPPPPPVNQSPIAVDDSATTNKNVSVIIDVLANDSDPDGDPLEVVSVGPANKGTVTLNGDNTVIYQPGSKPKGSDTFSYVIRDSAGNMASATVTITFQKVNKGKGRGNQR